MKNIFGIITISFIVLAGFIGCKRPDSTATDILTNPNGWVLSSAFSNPPYRQNDGSFARDLVNDEYLKNFEASYIIIFTSTGNEIVRPGSYVAPSPEDGFTAETTLGFWKFDNPEKPTSIAMHIPFLNNGELIDCKILNLAKNDFRITCVVPQNEEEGVTEKDTCIFTLTYIPAE